jgi:hypothetical protein
MMRASIPCMLLRTIVGHKQQYMLPGRHYHTSPLWAKSIEPVQADKLQPATAPHADSTSVTQKIINPACS